MTPLRARRHWRPGRLELGPVPDLGTVRGVVAGARAGEVGRHGGACRLEARRQRRSGTSGTSGTVPGGGLKMRENIAAPSSRAEPGPSLRLRRRKGGGAPPGRRVLHKGLPAGPPLQSPAVDRPEEFLQRQASPEKRELLVP